MKAKTFSFLVALLIILVLAACWPTPEAEIGEAPIRIVEPGMYECFKAPYYKGACQVTYPDGTTCYTFGESISCPWERGQ